MRRHRVEPARRVAFEALRRVDSADAYLNLALPALLRQAELSARDAAFATELAYGTSRARGSYDAVLDRCVRAGIESLEPRLHVALLLGLHQLLGMRVPTHAAVSTTVELVRSEIGERPVRLANAVLRAASKHDLEAWMRELAPSYDADPIGHLEVTCSHPRWIIEAYRDVLGELDHVRALLVANNTPAPVTLAVRPGLAQLSDLADIPGEPGRWSPFGWRLAGGSPATVSLVQDGRVGVQDEGSQLAAQALAAAAPGGRWLDLCAGPGGKAALLAGLARSGTAGGSSSAPSDAKRSGPAAPRAELLAVERQPHRARLVADALRAYTSVPRVVVADGTVPPWNDASFDAVLVDVPCTGLGALRRRPESRWRRQPADLDSLVPLQRRLLASALDSTRPGGVVGYVTCSPHRDETVGVVESVCATREDIEPMDTPRVLAEAIGAEAADFGRGPYVQLWPHVHDTDAMFVALLRRRDL